MPAKPANKPASGRRANGTFRKGVSGNPSGRPKAISEVTEMARAHGEAAIAALVAVLEADDAPHAAKVSAANSLLDRGYGKPVQDIALSGEMTFIARLPGPVANVDEWQERYRPMLPAPTGEQ